MPVMIGSSHSSKYTFGRRGNARGRSADLGDVLLGLARIGLGLVVCTDHRAQPADIGEDAVDAAMVADPYLHAGLDQLARDIGLDVGKADRQVRLQLEDLADLSRW